MKKEECGIVGILCQDDRDISYQLTFGLFALQHRGEEAAGIATSNGKNLFLHKEKGHVDQVFNAENLKLLKGPLGIGHVRYSITGASNLENAHPFIHIGCSKRESFAIVHNGNLTNSKILKEKLEKNNVKYKSTSDSESILHLIIHSKKSDFADAVADAMSQLEGAFCVLVLTKDKIFAIRDKNGFRPLVYGQNKYDDFMVASESTSLSLSKFSYLGEVDPGKMLIFEQDKKVIEKQILPKAQKISRCIFELIYFSKPDSVIFDESVYFFRKKLGKKLAQQNPIDADIVMPIPDSGVHLALGYSQQSGIPLEMGIIRNHYVGRSFIQPNQKARRNFVKIKLSPVNELIEGKRVVIVDDSIVRGTTTREKIRRIRKSGAKEVHMRVGAPPIKYPCFYGIDFPDEKKLIANNMEIEEIRKFLKLDSLEFISVDNLFSIGKDKNYCAACFTGKYPIKVDGYSRDILES